MSAIEVMLLFTEYHALILLILLGEFLLDII